MTRLLYFLIKQAEFWKRGQFSALFIMLPVLFVSAQNDTVRDDQSSDYNLNRPERVEWFRNTGAGLFIHFGVDVQLGIVISHSLVGASDDYVERYFNQLPQTFDPVRWSPREIAGLAKLAGMKYIVFTTKHHSGFCMWDTRTSPFNIMNTPYHKDLLRECIEATRAAGLGVGLYFSPEDFWFLHQHGIPISRTDVKMDDSVRQVYNDYTRRQCEELMTRYGKIDVLFIDGVPKEVVKSTCWRLQPDLLITRGAMKTPEQVLPGEKISDPWLSCITMGTAWQYQPTNERYKSGTQLIQLLIEARAKGGSLLLNAGPMADGSLSPEQEGRLREIAAWYFINHECMDSVRSWVVSREGDIWFTARDTSTLYAIVTSEWKEGERKTFHLHSVRAGPGTRMSVLGQNSRNIEYKNDDVSCRLRQVGNDLELSAVKAQRIYDDHRWPDPVVIKLESVHPAFDEAVDVRTRDSRAVEDGILFSGQVFGAGRGLVKRARFYYRPYAGQVETLYAAPWTATGWVSIGVDGVFHLAEKKVRRDKQYEYRAVVEYRQVEINGEDKIYKPAPARLN
jgi:alpha-L-fucosidase